MTASEHFEKCPRCTIYDGRREVYCSEYVRLVKAEARREAFEESANLLEVLALVQRAADEPMASGKRDGFTRPTDSQWRKIVTEARAAFVKAASK